MNNKEWLIQNKKRKSDCVLFVFLLFFFIMLVSHGLEVLAAQEEAIHHGTLAAQQVQQTKDSPIEILYFGYNTCASCSPEEEFYEILRSEIGDLREEIPYTVYEYNTFHLDAKEKLNEYRKKLNIPDNEGNWPVVIIRDQYLIGLEAVKLQMRSLLLENGDGTDNPLEKEEETDGVYVASELEEEKCIGLSEILKEQNLDDISVQDSVILYFSTISCENCMQVKKKLKDLGDKIVLENGEESKVRICEISIAEEEKVPILWQLFEYYRVPEEQQQVPILFYEGGYLAGADAVMQNLDEELKIGKMQNFTMEDLDGEETGSIATAGKMAMAATGFVNGLNPCGASMLLMLLAAAVVVGNGVWKIGLSYLFGKFLSYFAMGFGLYQVFLHLDTSLLSTVSQVISRIFAVFFLLLAVMYLVDFWHIQRNEYGKVRMQLPAVLRKWNHDKIEQFSKVSGKKLLPAVFFLGMIISAGEFFCTGQVYLAAIMYLMKAEVGNLDVILTFVVYITAMCIPSLLLVGLIEKTGNVIRASNHTLEWMPMIKLLTAAVFLAAAAAMLFL